MDGHTGKDCQSSQMDCNIKSNEIKKYIPKTVLVKGVGWPKITRNVTTREAGRPRKAAGVRISGISKQIIDYIKATPGSTAENIYSTLNLDAKIVTNKIHYFVRTGRLIYNRVPSKRISAMGYILNPNYEYTS